MRLYTDCRDRRTPSTLSSTAQALLMGLKLRIFATSNGFTIDAVGDGRYLVCNKTSCCTVKGLNTAHAALRRQDSASH